MQQIINVLQESATQDLVSLADMKKKMFIPDTDTSKDFLIQELITNTSETIARLCNRIFGYGEVQETFYQLEDGSFTQRLYLSRWPVKLADILGFTQEGDDILTSLVPGPIINNPIGQFYAVLEEATGTLYLPSFEGQWGGSIDVHYKGGYELPDGAPGALKFAVEALIRESYVYWMRDPSSYGVRQIKHKESHIGYYGPKEFGSSMGQPETWKTLQDGLLYKFIRHWV